MHGEIGVHSELNKGSTFWFTALIPRCSERSFLKENQAIQHKRNKTSKDVAPKCIKSLSVLVVEDNCINQIVVKKLLSSFGCKVTIAKDGLVAVQMLQEQLSDSRATPSKEDNEEEPSSHFDLILCDIQMPGLNG